MEFKGTKGKWEIKEGSNTKNLWIEGGEPVCLIYKRKSREEKEKANALLISKAPEMLEMLQECRTQLVLCTLLDKSGQCSKMVEEIEQLIKEATEI